MKKYFIFALCTMLSVGLITGCGSKKEEKKDENKEKTVETNEQKPEETNEIKGSNQIESCPNCVFAFYDNLNPSGEYQGAYYAGDNRTILTDYTTDYTTLKDANGDQRTAFLGHVLDKDGKITRGFVCAIENGQVFCIEGTTDGSKNELNKEILKKVYGEDKCYPWGSENGLKCFINYESSSMEDGSVTIFKAGSGDVSLNNYSISCSISSYYKTMSCREK